MTFFVSREGAEHLNEVYWSKEELLDALSKMIDDSFHSGGSYFDLTIHTDGDN
jgi:hypothetical protein